MKRAVFCVLMMNRGPIPCLLVLLSVANVFAQSGTTNQYSAWPEEKKKAHLSELALNLQSPNAIAQKSAAISMGRLGLKEAVPHLLKALASDRIYDPTIRMEIMGALGRLRDERATVPLISWVSNTDPLLQGAAILALGGIGDPKAVPALIPLLSAGAPIMRHMAMTALGNIGDERALEHLDRISKNDPNNFLKVEAAIFARKIREGGKKNGKEKK